MRSRAMHRVRRRPVRVPFDALARRQRRDDSRPGTGQDDPLLQGPGARDGRRGAARHQCKENVTLQDFAVEDARGDAIKSKGTSEDRLPQRPRRMDRRPEGDQRRLRLLPVLCTDVVIEDCAAIGASDAGIYVGQSENIIVRREPGREERGRHRDRELGPGRRLREPRHRQLRRHPGLHDARPAEEGRPLCRVFNNRVLANNHENFAPKGNTVASVPPGTGIMFMANDQVEVFDNTIEQQPDRGPLDRQLPDHGKADQGREVRSVLRSDLCPRQPVRIQRRQAGGRPGHRSWARSWARRCRTSCTTASATERKLVGGKLPETLGIRIRDNGKASFANFDGGGSKRPPA